MLPRFTEPSDLAGIEGLAPGTMSAGLSTVTASQTYLDIGAGNRVFTSLYPGDEVNVEPEFDTQVPGWDHIVERAEAAPAEIVPGLLASTLQDEGILVRSQQLISTAALIVANRAGQIERVPPGGDCVRNPCGGVTVTSAFPRAAARGRSPPCEAGHADRDRAAAAASCAASSPSASRAGATRAT